MRAVRVMSLLGVVALGYGVGEFRFFTRSDRPIDLWPSMGAFILAAGLILGAAAAYRRLPGERRAPLIGHRDQSLQVTAGASGAAVLVALGVGALIAFIPGTRVERPEPYVVAVGVVAGWLLASSRPRRREPGASPGNDRRNVDDFL